MQTLLDRRHLLSNPPPLGCVLCLPGLPGGGSKIYDRSPYGNHGAITGATWARTPAGLWYLSFDGSDDYIDCGRNTSLLITGDLTAEWWMNLADYSNNNFVLGQSETDGYSGVYSFIVAATSGYLYFYRGNGTSESSDRSVVAIGTGWRHIVVTMLGTAVKMYSNLTDVTRVGSLSATIGDSGENIRAGRREDDYAPFSGGMALVRIYNRALSFLEIQNHFNREKHLFGVW